MVKISQNLISGKLYSTLAPVCSEALLPTLPHHGRLTYKQLLLPLQLFNAPFTTRTERFGCRQALFRGCGGSSSAAEAVNALFFRGRLGGHIGFPNFVFCSLSPSLTEDFCIWISSVGNWQLILASNNGLDFSLDFQMKSVASAEHCSKSKQFLPLTS